MERALLDRAQSGDAAAKPGSADRVARDLCVERVLRGQTDGMQWLS
jgi:hypothetical protein